MKALLPMHSTRLKKRDSAENTLHFRHQYAGKTLRNKLVEKCPTKLSSNKICARNVEPNRLPGRRRLGGRKLGDDLA
jgi:hypothetical protein